MDGGSEKGGCGGVWWTPMEEEPPWEHGSLLYWVKKVEKMKKMEENGVGRERGEEREMECGMLGILIGIERNGDIYSGES